MVFAKEVFETEMRYLESDGDYHLFELDHDHPGHQEYKGCSGAPILDNEGNLVALVASGAEDSETQVAKRMILGTSLQKFRRAFDVALSQEADNSPAQTDPPNQGR